jgi:[ribosomal protein S5]-alanine N-acetyltransferase
MPDGRGRLIPRTRDEVRADIDAWPAEMRAQLSAEWLAQLEKSAPQDPWVHGFHVLDESGTVVGQGGFKGPPVDGIAEIAYYISPEHQGRGYATAAARALAAYAFESENVRAVRAHTLADGIASQRVLTKAGFLKLGEVVDPDDGPVWRFELTKR